MQKFGPENPPVRLEDKELLDQRFRELIKKAGLPLKGVAQALDISVSDCWEWWMGRKSLPNYSKLKNLESEWTLKLEALATGETNLQTIRQKVFGPSKILPEKYAKHALSYVSSSRHILEVIRMQHGAQSVSHMLLQLGINPTYFDDINNRISLEFFEDALEYFLNLGYKWRDFDWLSKALFLTVEETELKRMFPVCSSYEEAYELIRKSTGRFDRNFDYHFSLSDKGLSLLCRPSDELVEATNSKCYGSRDLYKYRAYLFGNMPDLCGLDPLPVRVMSCISQGASFCHYDIKFPAPTHNMKLCSS